MYIVLIFTKDGTPQVLDGQIVWWSFVQIGDTLLSESVVFKLWTVFYSPTFLSLK